MHRFPSYLRRILTNIFFIFLILSTCAFSIYRFPKGKFTPPPGKTLLFIGQDRDTIADYVKITGNIPGGMMLYTSVQEVAGLSLAANYGAGFQDGQALVKSYPHSVIQIGLYMVDALDEIVAGKYNSNLQFLCDWIKKTNRPVFLRIGYEFDHPGNHYSPQVYKAAFRYIVDFFHEQNVQNVAFVWHSAILQIPQQPWMDWYPGDDYVDWFGASIFSTSKLEPAGRFMDLAREHHKPFMIAESTPQGMYTARGKADWFKHVFKFIRDKDVQAFCYINSNWDAMPMYKGQQWGDQRIEADSEITALWKKEIDSDRYLKASAGLFQKLDFLRP